jgi:hypothetical protein
MFAIDCARVNGWPRPGLRAFCMAADWSRGGQRREPIMKKMRPIRPDRFT